MKEARAIGVIDDYKVSLNKTVKERLNGDIKEMFKNGELVELIIKKKGKRSLPQNAYYWGVVIPEIKNRFKELGHDLDGEDVHEYLKQRFNSEKVVIESTGELLEIGKTTTQLNREEFGYYLERIIQFANETLEIIIPEPNRQTQMF